MKKFLAIYYSPAEAEAQMETMTPEQIQEVMKPWMDWNERVGTGMIDLGAPLAPGNNLNTSGKWSESQTEVSGYSIVQGESLEAVKELFKNHPHLAWDPRATIAIHECSEM